MFENLIWLILVKKWRWKLLHRFGLLPPKHVQVRRIRKRYYKNFGCYPDLENPKRFTEKVQWLKLNYRDSSLPILADKIAVRDFLKEQGLGEILIPKVATYDRAEEIDFSSLPKSFVIKVTHDSGGVVVVEDKAKLDQRSLIKKLQRNLSLPFMHGVQSGEWHYQLIKPRIIIEQLVRDSSGLTVCYQFHCFHGKPQLIMVDRTIDGAINRVFYDLEWNRQDLVWKQKAYHGDYSRPDNLSRMLEIAEKLSAPFPYVRVDLYAIDEKIYFGELTFFHGSGMWPMQPDSRDYQLGELLQLDNLNYSQTWISEQD